MELVNKIRHQPCSRMGEGRCSALVFIMQEGGIPVRLILCLNPYQFH